MPEPAAFLVAWSTYLQSGSTRDHFKVFRTMDYASVDAARAAARKEYDSRRAVVECHSASLCEVLDSTDY